MAREKAGRAPSKSSRTGISCRRRHGSTLRADRPTGKVHFRGGIMGHFRRRPAPRPRRAARAGRARARAARGGPDRPAARPAPGCRRPAPWPPTSDRPQHRRRGLRPAGRRGLADRPAGLRHPRSPSGPAPPAPAAASRGRPAAVAAVRPACRARPTSPRSRAPPGWRAARRALATAPADAFGYGDPRGRPELRHALADYLARARGVRADPERIVVCAGFVQGLGLLCAALRAGGARTWRSRPTACRPHRELVAAPRAAAATAAGRRARRRVPSRRRRRRGCC